MTAEQIPILYELYKFVEELVDIVSIPCIGIPASLTAVILAYRIYKAIKKNKVYRNSRTYGKRH